MSGLFSSCATLETSSPSVARRSDRAGDDSTAAGSPPGVASAGGSADAPGSLSAAAGAATAGAAGSCSSVACGSARSSR